MKLLLKTLLASVIALGICNISYSQTTSNKAPGISPSVHDFNAISVGGPINVFVTMGNEESLRIEASEENVKNMIVEVKNNTLVLKLKNSSYMWKHSEGKINAYVTAKQLRGLTVGGSGSLKVEGTVKADNVDLTVSGSGNMNLTAEASSLESTVSGSGSIRISGTADKSDITVSGSGSFNGNDLKSNKTSVVVSGSGEARIHTEQALEAVISGSGSVNYSGSPTNIDTKTSGSGRVKKVD
ncbi:DUF2807 domain-containing protein [Solitalea sp. MAHUQ-68]|uniref:DUF2807 domain-containing protein n=1 Tax=Solitalea agri TaxID=2953739 RepID=A0A9X2F0D0_9SPHI|nr:head GIN domain-containing protein [Solitalea agri]MCO4291795.1 DUF2807 domain-containing protein [Solitalea agri]